jgi:hypothetical protein
MSPAQPSTCAVCTHPSTHSDQPSCIMHPAKMQRQVPTRGCINPMHCMSRFQTTRAWRAPLLARALINTIHQAAIRRSVPAKSTLRQSSTPLPRNTSVERPPLPLKSAHAGPMYARSHAQDTAGAHMSAHSSVCGQTAALFSCLLRTASSCSKRCFSLDTATGSVPWYISPTANPPWGQQNKLLLWHTKLMQQQSVDVSVQCISATLRAASARGPINVATQLTQPHAHCPVTAVRCSLAAANRKELTTQHNSCAGRPTTRVPAANNSPTEPGSCASPPTLVDWLACSTARTYSHHPSWHTTTS